MRSPLKDAQDMLVQLWEQAVQLHQRLKTDPSLQCAWDLVKLVIRLLLQLISLYIKLKIH